MSRSVCSKATDLLHSKCRIDNKKTSHFSIRNGVTSASLLLKEYTEAKSELC